MDSYLDKKLDQVDNFTGKKLYSKPDKFTTVQWMQRVRKILCNYNCLNIDTDKATEKDKEFSERITDDTTHIPFDLFKDMYEHYTSEYDKEMDKVMVAHPGCCGTKFESGKPPVPIYSTDIDLGTVETLDKLNFVGKCWTNGF